MLRFPQRFANLNLLLLISAALAMAAGGASACDLCVQHQTFICPVATDNEQTPAAFGAPRPGWPQSAPGEPVYLSYSYQNLLDGGLKDPAGNSVPVAQIRTAIEEAFEVWSEVAPLHFTEVADDGLPYGQSTQHGVIRLRHIYINGPDPPVGDPTTKARAYFPYTSIRTNHVSGDVEFDDSDPWALIGTTREPDILGAAIHELGHSLGLTHSSIPGVNMYWIFKRHTGPGSGELLPDDIAAIQSVYGAGVGSVTPLSYPVPEPPAAIIAVAFIAGLAYVRKLPVR